MCESQTPCGAEVHTVYFEDYYIVCNGKERTGVCPKMNLSKIHHIAIIVSDYETAKDFYVNKLGFSVVRENYRPERKDWKLELLGIEHLSEDAAPDD